MILNGLKFVKRKRYIQINDKETTNPSLVKCALPQGNKLRSSFTLMIFSLLLMY